MCCAMETLRSEEGFNKFINNTFSLLRIRAPALQVMLIVQGPRLREAGTTLKRLDLDLLTGQISR